MTDSGQPYFRILTLDGGGAKGFYSLGVLKEIEALTGGLLCQHFDLIFGTSTGAIIAALLALGRTVDEIHELYKNNVPGIMLQCGAPAKSAALANLADEVFGDAKFDDTKTDLGIVTTNWATERPMIFKSNKMQAHGRSATFIPGFGVTIADAVQASASAYPFFERKFVTTKTGNRIELADGGYCANNPTLYAIADAVHAYQVRLENIRVVSIGVGVYPPVKTSIFSLKGIIGRLPSVQLLQKTLEVNTQSMEQLRAILFKNVDTVRINDTFDKPEMATDMLEHDLRKLNILRQRGGESFSAHETKIRTFFNGGV